MFEMNHSIPDAKAKKYDRQLRLWGDHGQIALECAKVCLINCDATGVEILKNLILPGVGSFTIVDDHIVSAQDVAVNFFLTEDHIGKFRGECVTDLLKEMNPDVAGSSVAENVDSLLDNNPYFFQHFQLVIVMAHSHSLLLKLSSILWSGEVAVLVVQNAGMVAVVRMVVNEHTVIEAHPDNSLWDLRLNQPFDELLKLCGDLHLPELSLKSHSHVPWLLLVLKYLQQWRQHNNGDYPSTTAHKKQLKQMISDGRLRREDGWMEDEENFEEAIKNLNIALLPTRLPDHIKDLFDHTSCLNIHSESKPFWILLSALKDFVAETGHLPLAGSLPDMTSDSESYMRLQQVYRKEAASQAEKVMLHVERILQAIGRDEPLIVKKIVKPSPTSSPARPEDCITPEDVYLFCKTSPYLRVIQTPSLQHQLSDHRSILVNLAKGMECEDEESGDELTYLLLFGASLRFHDNFNRHPGDLNGDYEADICSFKTCVHEYMMELHIPSSVVKDEFIHEFCRFGRSEIACVSGMVGGVVAQEAIKLITHQFVPFDNTLVYDAVKQSTRTFRL